MIELFQTLLAGVAAAALCGGAALALTRGSALREVMRLAGGLAVLLAVLQPLSGLRLPDLTGALRQAVDHNTAQSAVYEQDNARVLAEAAGQRVKMYVEQRAAQCGVPCTAVLATAQDANGTTLLTGLTLTASGAARAQAGAVEQVLASECGIPKELVTWNWTE